MALCDQLTRHAVTRCVLAEGHTGGHRGVGHWSPELTVVTAWPAGHDGDEQPDPIIVGVQ